jgi:hypothetical protein
VVEAVAAAAIAFVAMRNVRQVRNVILVSLVIVSLPAALALLFAAGGAPWLLSGSAIGILVGAAPPLDAPPTRIRSTIYLGGGAMAVATIADVRLPHESILVLALVVIGVCVIESRIRRESKSPK